MTAARPCPRSRLARAALLLASTAGIAAAAAAPASAGIVRAQSVLPPGQSGFVSVSGLADGTGSPHLYDQQQPFIDFARKDAMLNQPGTEEDPKPGVRILRDAYGVPSVYGDDDADAWWGAGYAIAEDRLFQLELFRRATEGRLAEILGKDYLSTDIATRRDFYTPSELDAMFARLPAALQQRYHSYADGVNAWVAHVRSTPTDLPGEFVATGDTPPDFTIEDLLAIGVYLARTTPNGDGSDLDNARALQASGPRIFDRILPLRTPGQLSTIPRANGLFPSDPGRTRAQERAAFARSTAFVRGLPLPPAASSSSAAGTRAGGAAGLIRPIVPGGSSMIAIGDRRARRAFLFSGPELGFTAPEELVELEVHRPGLDVRGVTAAGAPVIAIGHNRHVAWGLTSGLTETNNLYAEKLVPGHPEEYFFRGRILQMSCRDETFSWRTPPSSALGVTSLLSSPPSAGSEVVRLCRTIHGPVQARAGNVAYARRYATWMREAETLVGLAGVDEAGSVAAVGRAVAKVTWNENLMAADDRGNIGYWHPGLLPREPVRWDERLPLPGTGGAEWRGFLSVKQRPHVINPRQGWLANWNNIPSQGWTTGNDPASERVAGRWFRVAWLFRLIGQGIVHAPSFTKLQGAIERAGTTAEQRPLAAGDLRRALTGARGGAKVVLRTILDWDGSYNRVGADGKTDPGVTAWQEFKHQAQRIALKPLGVAGQIIGGGDPNDEHVFDVSLGQAYALRTLSPAGWRVAAAATFNVLAARFGSGTPSAWRLPRVMFNQASQGAEQPPPMPFFDRGTWEQIVELKG